MTPSPLNQAAKIVEFPRCNANEAVRCIMAPVIASQAKAVVDLEAWQQKQNGSLGRIEAKVDTLVQRVDDRISGLQYWIMGTLATALVATLGWVMVLLRPHA